MLNKGQLLLADKRGESYLNIICMNICRVQGLKEYNLSTV